MKKKLSFLFLKLPFFILLTAFAVVNRHSVPFHLLPTDIFGLSITLNFPFFIYMFLFFGFGALFGWVMAKFFSKKPQNPSKPSKSS